MLLDFNDAAPQIRLVDPAAEEAALDALRQVLRDRAREVVQTIFPEARITSSEARIGDVSGARGESLSIALTGEHAGQWHDHATGESGDLISLWMLSQGCDFPTARRELADWLNPARPRFKSRVQQVADQRRAEAAKKPKVEERLGPPVATYHYMAADGQTLLGIVRRYELDGLDERGKPKKTFRPTRPDGSAGMPDPRPLYLLPAIATASEVVLVEGEKCANALADIGIVATTQMGGAKADPAKTDWSPLAGKSVLVWEDNDQAGSGLTDRVRSALEAIGCKLRRLAIPAGKPPSWDAADAVAEGQDIAAILAAPTADKPDTFRLYTIRDLAALKPPEWRIDGILPTHGTSVLYGAYQTFKSFVALDKLLSLASGLDWLGRASKPCPVLYIAGEGQTGVSSRAAGWCSARNVDMDAVRFLALPEAIAIPDPGSLEKLKRTIGAMREPPEVIALDTITRMAGGASLNDEKDVAAYVAASDALRLFSGAHIMHVGHSGKDTNKGLFGSIVLPAAMETIICVERSGPHLTLINSAPKGKQKDGPNFEDIRLRTITHTFDRAGVQDSTLIIMPDDEVVVLEETSEAKPPRRLGANQKAVMTALERAARDGQGLGFTRLVSMTKLDKGALGGVLRGMVADGRIIENPGDPTTWRLP